MVTPNKESWNLFNHPTMIKTPNFLRVNNTLKIPYLTDVGLNTLVNIKLSLTLYGQTSSLEPSHHLQLCSKDVRCARSSSTGLHLEACAVPSPDYRKTLQQRARVQCHSNTVQRGSPVAVMGTAKTSPSHGDHM